MVGERLAPVQKKARDEFHNRVSESSKYTNDNQSLASLEENQKYGKEKNWNKRCDIGLELDLRVWDYGGVHVRAGVHV